MRRLIIRWKNSYEYGWIEPYGLSKWRYIINSYGERILWFLGYYEVAWRVATLICKYFGHDTEDNSSIGPDHGIEDISCRRCGWGFRHVYY